MDSRDRFSQAADDYAKYRPDYPDELVVACAEYASLQPGAAVVDIGCGTGISTRRFAKHGYAVIGVEPNLPMLQKARQAGGPSTPSAGSGQAGSGRASYKEGDAANTGLDDDCCELIICAQALHWFDLDDCAGEWRRVLKGSSTGSGNKAACAAFWNYRRDDGWQAEYEELLQEWSDEYGDVRKAVDGGQDNSAWVKNSPLCSDVTELEFANAQRMDYAALLGRANSSSYVIHGVKDRPGFEHALKKLFDKHQQDGALSFRYRTYLLLWRFRSE